MLTIAVEDNATIHLLNTHAELAASKYKLLTPKYLLLFGNFLKAIEAADYVSNYLSEAVFLFV